MTGGTLPKLRKALSRLKKPDESDNEAIVDDRLWSLDLEKHAYGDFSLAVAQANVYLEDQSQVEAHKDFTFVGVYDGHNGPDASRFFLNNLFTILMGAYEQQGKMSSEILTEAISESERLFTEHVRATYRKTPILAGEGSSCLIAVIQGEELYVVNLGDCRAVMGVSVKPNKILRVVVGDSVRTQKIRAEQLTEDHNVNIEEVRKEVQAEHPNDPNILEKRNGILYLREITQVSRGLGHACLKHPDLAITPIINNPITRAVLRCDPDVYNRTMTQSDRFLILASHGFWIHMTNEDAVNTVFKHPHAGIAKRLLTKAMKKAARKKERGYDSVKEMLQMKRIEIHDDMTVAVIFIDYEWLKRESPVHRVSVKGFTAGPSSSGSDKPGPSNSGADTIGFLAYSRRKNQGLVIMIN